MNTHGLALVVFEETAHALKESAENIVITSAFDEGRLMGYYEALSTLISQCAVLGINLGDIGLADFKAESLLENVKRDA